MTSLEYFQCRGRRVDASTMLRMRPMSKKVSLNTIANSTLGNRWGCRRKRTTSSQREPRIASIERPLARYAISGRGVGGAGRWVGGAGELGGSVAAGGSRSGAPRDALCYKRRSAIDHDEYSLTAYAISEY